MDAWSSIFPQARLGWIVGEGGFGYRLTTDDLRWLCRSLIGESRALAASIDGAAICWTYGQRLYLYRNTPLRWRGIERRFQPPHSLVRIIRSHSQPVNPYWVRPDVASPAMIRQRMRFWTLSPADVERWSPGTIDLVRAWATGRVRNLWPGIVDFAACSESIIGEHGTPAAQHVNCFWKSEGTGGYTENTVRVGPRPRGGRVLVGLGIAAATIVTARYLLP